MLCMVLVFCMKMAIGNGVCMAQRKHYALMTQSGYPNQLNNQENGSSWKERKKTHSAAVSALTMGAILT